MPLQQQQDIRELTREDLRQYFLEKGDKAFRGSQVHEWLWKKHVLSFEEMSNLPQTVRENLSRDFSLHKIALADQQIARDKTIKNAFRLHDGHIVEGVLIPQGKRMTACISSQVGCALSCDFCATARMKRVRNLAASEIYDQVALLNEQAEEKYGHHLSNIVYMGMGEPLLNYKNVVNSIRMITAEEGMGMSPRRITVSTVGVSKMIRKLADEALNVNLAVSLHVANDEKRSSIMDINRSNDLDTLLDSIRYFHEKSGIRITYEFIVFRDLNDNPEDADQLAAFCHAVPSKVNIIEYNPIDNGTLAQTSRKKFEAFIGRLEDQGVIVNVRRSRGKDIDAACGQLANKNQAVSKENRADMLQ